MNNTSSKMERLRSELQSEIPSGFLLIYSRFREIHFFIIELALEYHKGDTL